MAGKEVSFSGIAGKCKIEGEARVICYSSDKGEVLFRPDQLQSVVDILRQNPNNGVILSTGGLMMIFMPSDIPVIEKWFKDNYLD